MFRPFGTPGGTAAPFGTPQSTQNAGTVGFGTPGGFGASSSQFGAQPSALGAMPRYAVTTDVDNNGTTNLQTITAMPAYQNKSVEELRLEDYSAGRKGSSAPFGGGQPATSGGIFGTTAGSATGAPTNPFGSAGTSTTTGSMFGTQQPPAFGTNTGGIFGAPTPATQPQTMPFGGFGSTQQPTAGGMFGAPTQATQQQAPTTSTGFGTFGRPPTATTTSGFGAFGGQPGTSATVGGFGGAGSTGSFGNLPSATAPSTGLFGKPTTTTGFGGGAAAAPLFGGGPTTVPSMTTGSGGLFGTTTSTQQPTQASAGTGLFSFGATQTTAAPSGGGFTFGTTPATAPQQTTGGLFNAAPTNVGGFSFNTGAPQTSTLPNTTAPTFSFGTGASPATTLTQPAGGFSFNLGGATSTAPAAMATAPTMPLPLISSEALSIKPPIPTALATPKVTPTTSSAGTLSAKQPSAVRSPARFTPRASFRLQPPSEVTLTSMTPSTGLVTAAGFVLPKRVSAKKLVVSDAPVPESRSASLSRISSLGEMTPFPADDNRKVASTGVIGEKYMIPNEATLRKLPYTQLCAVQNFTVGQRGIGQVRFLQPVDLSKISPCDIFEKIVVFEPKLVTLYPDDEFPGDEKPAPGFGLNVPAEVRLECCWCVSKADRHPIKDMGDQRLQAHIERLKKMPDTQFIDYLPDSGTWIFRVEHFSSYGLVEDDNDNNDHNVNDHNNPPITTATTIIATEFIKTAEWIHSVFRKSVNTFNGAGRKSFISWLPDGSGVISRFNLASIWTILSPPCLPLDSDKLNNTDKEIEEMILLTAILKDGGSGLALNRWLRRRFLERVPLNMDPRLRSLCLAEFSGYPEMLRAAGLERLEVMTEAQTSPTNSLHYAKVLSAMANIQLSLASASAPEIEKLTLATLAGNIKDDHDSIPWEGLLLASLHYPPRSLKEAVNAMSVKGDLLWNLLQYFSNGNRENILNTLKPTDSRDWTRSFAIAKSIDLESLTDGKEMMRVLERQLAGQLLASGQWELAARLSAIDIGPFILTNEELMTQTRITEYRHKEESIEKIIGNSAILILKSYRAGYFGRSLERIHLLLRAGETIEAQKWARPLLVNVILRGIEEPIVSLILDKLSTEQLEGFSLLVKFFLDPSSVPHSRVAEELQSLQPMDDFEVMAISSVSCALLREGPFPSLLPLLVPDHRMTIIRLYSMENKLSLLLNN